MTSAKLRINFPFRPQENFTVRHCDKRIMTSPTHYDILAIPRSYLEEGADPSLIVKTAYHRALLRNHPDKALNIKPGEPRVTSTGQITTVFTIDQISAAYAVLSDATKRAEYDKALKVSSASRGGDSSKLQSDFQTGIEDVDLDDLEFDEVANRWSRSCRCGNERGFTFGEDDLEEAGDLGELLVGCQDCSLWLRIHFAIADEAAADAQQPC